MSVLRDLLASDGLFCVDYRTGSPTDRVGAIVPTVEGTPLLRPGAGLRTTATAAAPNCRLRYGVGIGDLPDLTQPRSWLIMGQVLWTSWVGFVITKMAAKGWDLLLTPSAAGMRIVDAWSAGNYMELSVAGSYRPSRQLVCVTYDGSRQGTGLLGYMLGGQMGIAGAGSIAAAGVTSGSNLDIGHQGSASGVTDVGLFAMFTRVLAPSEISALFLELDREIPGLLDAPKRKFSFPYPTLTPAQAAAQGLVLDTDFVRRSDGKVRNLAPTAYSGTVVGAPVPSQGGEGMVFNGSTDAVSMGDVTQINGARYLTYSFVIRLPSTGVVSGGTIHGKTSLATGARTQTQVIGPSPGPHALQYYEISPAVGAHQRVSNSAVLYAGMDQHVVIVRDGDGTTDSDKIKMYVDGTLVPATSYAFPFGATTDPSLAGFPLDIGREFTAVNPLAATVRSLRVRSTALTAAEVRAEYLQWAKRLLLDGRLRSDGSCPVSLTNLNVRSIQVPGTIWQGVQTTPTTLGVVEDAGTGERYLNMSARIGVPQGQAFGSWAWEWQVSNLATFMPVASNPVAYATPPQNGYVIYQDGGGIQFGRSDNGVFANFANVVGAYNNRRLRFWLSRTSAGQFDLWLKDGVNAWILLASANDLTYVTSTWMIATGTGTARLYDVLHVQGAMTPAEATQLGLIEG